MGFTKLTEYNVALEKYKEDLKMELRGLRSDVNIETRKRQEDDNQLKKEMQIIETNLKKLIADEFRAMKGDMKKINLENSAIKKETANINDKIKAHGQQEVQLEDRQLDNSQLPNTEDLIEEFLKNKPSIDKLLDSFLFGTADEKKAFESLCLKWTIKEKDLVIPTEQWSRDHVSDIFPVYGFQAKAQLKLTIDSDGDITLYLCFFDEAREGQEVDLKLLPMVTYIVKDLSGSKKHSIKYYYGSFNSSLKYNQFVYGNELIKSKWTALLSPGAVSVEVLVLVEPMTIMNKPLSVDGTITHTIEHYSRKLQMDKEGLIGSHWGPPFLTHAGGYRVAVRMWLNRPISENKRGLALGIRFLSGVRDSELGKEFAHETSVTLINQWDTSNNITRKKQAKETNGYEMAIATHDAMGSGGFLVNDSFTYHVTVKPIK